MKQLFNITAAQPQHSDLLICELSHYHMCLARADAAAGHISGLQYYEKATPVTLREVTALLQEDMDSKCFKSLLIGSAFPDATLVPQDLAAEKDLQSFLQAATDVVFTDSIEPQDLQVVYTLPPHFQPLLNSADATRLMHVHTAAIRAQPEEVETYMALHFASKEFRVVVEKNGEVQLAQIYPFTAPLDVVYYMLMISAQYNLPQAEATIILSGLVDESSALYKEICQYFAQVQFAQQAPFTLPGNDYHPHFFSSIFNLAACASSVVS